jgi:hypothetical protein
MTKTALIRLQDEIDAVRREAFTEGYAAAMQSVREFASRPPPAASAGSGSPEIEADPAMDHRPPKDRRPRRGTNARLIESVLQSIAPRAAPDRNPQRPAAGARGGAGLHLDPARARAIGSPPPSRTNRPQQDVALPRRQRRRRRQPRLSNRAPLLATVVPPLLNRARRLSAAKLPIGQERASRPGAARPTASATALAPEAEFLGHCRALFGVGRCGQWMIAR